jgi:hypothetical protein
MVEPRRREDREEERKDLFFSLPVVVTGRLKK